MKKLLVVTFADKPLDKENFLRKTCEEQGITLEVLISSPWIQNVIKLKMLADLVETLDPELVLLVVDAYDVLIYGDSKEILQRFEAANTDILFSGESNFMYKEPAKWLTFLKKYPPQATIFQYLNSGSYIGKAKHLQQLLNGIQHRFDIDFENVEKLLLLKSDQYLLHRFYVEHYYEPATSLRLSIDADQHLMGCTGGRFCVVKWPDISKWQSFAFFVLERNLLKLFSLHKHQKRSKDFVFKQDRFFNRKTRNYSTVMHCPGTWDRFDQVLNELSLERSPYEKSLSWFAAALISCSSFILSFFVGPIFWMLTRKIS